MVTKAEPIRYVSDENGQVTAVVVPIDIWKSISAEIETRHLLSSEPMRRRLEEALAATQDVGFDEVLARVGVTEDEVR